MSAPVIEIKGLSKFYGKARGIEKVDLQVEPGEIFGFIGPNGAGKSTTIRILLNLIFPTAGSASIMGMDVIKDTRKIKHFVGYIPSDASAYQSMRVQEFLDYFLRFYQNGHDKNRIEELCSWFELDPKRKIDELSMGNRKKVAIVQSLLHRPTLLILDEPTTGLDPLMQARFFDLLRLENSKGMTIFFSSHVLNEVQMFCKRVAIIREGRIIQTEEIETLRKKQLKRVFIEFEDQLDAEHFALEGLEKVVARTPKTLSFMYAGRMNKLIAKVAGTRVLNLTIEEPSLEEIFMHYYH